MKKEQSTQDIFSISDIRNNLIYTVDGHAVTAIEIEPRAIDLMSEEAQNQIYEHLMTLVNGIDVPYQIFCGYRPSDISSYIVKMEEKISKETNFIKKDIMKKELLKSVEAAKTGKATEGVYGFILRSKNLKPESIDELVYKTAEIRTAFINAGFTAFRCDDDKLIYLTLVNTNPTISSYDINSIKGGSKQ